MLFKEQMFLANCDTVRQLPVIEIEKRFLIGVTLAKGVIVSPSLLLDNRGFIDVLKRPNLHRWYAEEGFGSLTIRSPTEAGALSMMDYFESLPAGFKLARCGGRQKQDLSAIELQELLDDLKLLDRRLKEFKPKRHVLALPADALTKAVTTSATFEAWRGQTSKTSDQMASLIEQSQGLSSRSAWYHAIERELGEDAQRFKSEVVDSAYHGLFVVEGEAFANDRIAILERIPPKLLDAGLMIRSLRQEKELLDYAIKGFDLITAFGAGEIAKFLMDEAISYVEEKAQDSSLGWFTRRNWFGLYPKLISRMGVEVK